MKKIFVLSVLIGLLCFAACNKDEDKDLKKESPWDKNSIVKESNTFQVDRGQHTTQYIKKIIIETEEKDYMISQGRRGDKNYFYECIEGGYWEGEVVTKIPEGIYYIWDENENFVDSATIILSQSLGQFTVNSFEYNKDTDMLTASWEQVEGANYYSLIISTDVGWIFYTTEGAQELYPRTCAKNYADFQLEKGKRSLNIQLGIDEEFCEKYKTDTFWVFLVAVNNSEAEELIKLGACERIYKGKFDL